MESGHVFAGVLAVAGCLQLALGVYAWRHEGKPGMRWFAAMATFGAAWVLTDVVGMVLLEPGLLRLWFGNFHSVTSIWAAIGWVGFVVTYTGRGHLLTRRRVVALSALPAVVSAAMLFAPTAPFVVESYGFQTVAGLVLIESDSGLVFAVIEVYLIALIFGLFALIARTFVEEGKPFSGQMVWILVGSLAIVVGVAIDIADAVPLDVLAPSVGASIQTGAFAIALFRYRLLRLVPAVRHVGESDAIEDLDDGIVIVAADGTITRINPAGRRLLGVADVVGGDVSEYLPELALDGPVDEETVTRRGRTYRVTASDITGGSEDPVGRALVVRDVTDREHRQQRLAVLNRLLRHNLRNDVDAIEKHAAHIEAETDGDVAASASTIRSLALGMADLGDKARMGEKALDRDDARPVTVDVAALVRDVVDEVAARSAGEGSLAAGPGSARNDGGGATVDVDASADLMVVTHPDPLALALRNVVENAVEHGSTSPDSHARQDAVEHGSTSPRSHAPEDAVEHGSTSPDSPDHEGEARSAPRVSVSAAATADGVAITVEDRGPGIPPEEVAVLEEGAESPLAHGSGIGLWLVHWATATLRGEVAFEATETGSRVTLTLPSLSAEGEVPGGPVADEDD